jgi:hypothetical protein
LEAQGIEQTFSELSEYNRTAIKDQLLGLTAKIEEEEGIRVRLEDVWESGNLVDIRIYYSDVPDRNEYQLEVEVDGNYEFVSSKELVFSSPHKCVACGNPIDSVTMLYKGGKPKIKNKKGKYWVDFDMEVEHCRPEGELPALVWVTHRYEADSKQEVQDYIDSVKKK